MVELELNRYEMSITMSSSSSSRAALLPLHTAQFEGTKDQMLGCSAMYDICLSQETSIIHLQ